jgi:hypothetical protein
VRTDEELGTLLAEVYRKNLDMEYMIVAGGLSKEEFEKIRALQKSAPPEFKKAFLHGMLKR